MNNKKADNKLVYTSTDLSDLLSSPVFYSVIALTFILGLSSIFGFLQNPRKLKTVVDVISSKVSSTQENTVSFAGDQYALLQPSLNVITGNEVLIKDNYRLFSVDNLRFKPAKKSGFQRVSFNYDITSKQFWGNLDSSRIESATEESKRKSTDALMIGVPIVPDYYPSDDDSKYSMTAGIIRSL